MLNKITTVLQIGLHASNLLAFLLSTMGVIDSKYAFLMEIEGKPSVINLSIPIMLTFGMWTLFYIFYFIRKIVVWKKNLRNSSNTNEFENVYIDIACIMVNAITGLFWMSFAAFQIYVFKNGHLPALDVLYRHYDLDSVCWDSIVYIKIDYTKNENLNQNCIYVNIYKKCIMCRMIVSDHEPTMFNQNYPIIITGVLAILAMQCWNLYVQSIEMRRNIRTKERAEAERAHFCDIDYCRDEEQESNSRLLKIVSEGRNSSRSSAVVVTPSPPPPPPSLSPSSSTVSETLSSFIATPQSPTSSPPLDNEFYFGNNEPDPVVYSVPQKVSCISPDACVFNHRTPMLSFKLFHKKPSPIKPVRIPIPTVPAVPPVPIQPVSVGLQRKLSPTPMSFSDELNRKFKEKKLLLD
ncbi:actin rearrangement inducing factor-1 [Maruca vitrata nucleopolyhedrovirus]|uniref:Actin rearrangement inducing factor-1 n=1 Tax=Maruca vitrata nucleopolyhedrovirus TaxID=1307954 RepID=A1YR74_9ABAC|nr:actin rearrangement inducing factor-1 [Maruca vitrata nucleopolyhedrovirus]ABL75964.1 actin rearrangement inducing factor-1 [Maruca vitrata nucleopolyhedrovirus]